MIFGIGLDIVAVNRVKNNAILANKILTKSELAVFASTNNANSYLAKRFAAKEAFVKATGLGIAKIGLHNIEVLNDNLGKPYIKILNPAKAVLAELIGSEYKIFVSIADEKDYAIAQVIIEKL